MIGDLFGWRGIFVVLGLFGLIVAILAFFAFRGAAIEKPAPLRVASVSAGKAAR